MVVCGPGLEAVLNLSLALTCMLFLFPCPSLLARNPGKGCRDNGLGFLGFRHCHLTLTFTLTLFTLALALAHVHATSHLEHGHSSASVKWHCSALSLRPDQECVHGIWRSKPRRFQSCSWSAARNNQALSSHPGDRTPARACKGRSLSGQQEERHFFFLWLGLREQAKKVRVA